MNFKTITLSLTLALTISYIGLVLLYGVAIAEGLSSKKASYGRNFSERITTGNEIVDQYYSKKIQKQVWEAQASEAELMLKLLNEENYQVSQ